MGVNKCFFLGVNSSHPSNKRSRGVNDTNVFVWGGGEMGSSPHIMRGKKNLKLPYLDNSFQHVAKI
jgi:hypothetical protein